MARRIQQIAPLAGITAIESFVEPDNLEALMPPKATVVIDAIDAVRAKAALVAWCVRQRLPVIVCGAAGGRRDPLRLQCEDLARTSGDSLLSSLRLRLRRDYGFAPAAGATGHDLARARKFGVPAIFSSERASGPLPGRDPGHEGSGGAPLACAGYGSIVTVTASMGMAAAARAIDVILAGS
jgi:tRNA A37 threonylcarbamoyladenosine dehydratase